MTWALYRLWLRLSPVLTIWAGATYIAFALWVLAVVVDQLLMAINRGLD